AFEVDHNDTAPFPHVATQAQTSPFELASSAPFQYEDATFAEPGARVRRRR
ncbi:MAG: hypothetical protein HOV81_29470, partial [Kofleriaceae bacterium]|nr:hypothetical protein [Kofleriaceae bacterium]